MNRPDRCGWCGSEDWRQQNQIWICENCRHSPEQAEDRAKLAREQQAIRVAAEQRYLDRRWELNRRTASVVDATRGRPMRERIDAARLLLWECLPLNAEQWDQRFAIWNRIAEPAEVVG